MRQNPRRELSPRTVDLPGFGWCYHRRDDMPNCSWCGRETVNRGGFMCCPVCDSHPNHPQR